MAHDTNNRRPLPRTSVPGVVWPPFPNPTAGTLLTLLSELDITQNWSPNELLTQQLRQIDALLKHAYQHNTFYSKRLAAADYRTDQHLDLDGLLKLPLLRRADILTAGGSIYSRATPQAHGRVMANKTSGSTGRPLEYRMTELNKLWWEALTLREHLWHQRDFQATLAVAREYMRNATYKTWGQPADLVFETGPSVTLDIRTDVNRQIEWLQQHKPAYFLTHPSNLRAIAELCLKSGLRLEGLKQLRCVGEIVDDSLRALCRRVFEATLVDMYSARETGYLALQCPLNDHYHVQSETVLVELLDETDQPTPPGQMGRVIVTVLHNFAMPLIRYDTEDYAMAGPACNCGRGLPTLQRVIGRQRNLVMLPDGRRYWPSLGHNDWMDVAPVQQIQIVQKSLVTVETKLVTDAPLTADQRAAFIGAVQKALGYPFEIEITYHTALPRSAGGKYEDFISLVETR